MKKKVLLFGYSRVNFGDDFFVYILAKKYANIDFYIHIKEEQYKKPFENIKNIHCLDTERDVRKVQISDFDAYIYVGGSIFIESEYSRNEVKEFNYFIKECKKVGKPFFYMTCNFGPYQTQDYLNLVRENFELATGVTIRDKDSYKLFEDIESVSYAPDMALLYNLDTVKEKQKKNTIGISVINLLIRDNLKDKNDIYEDYIKRIIIKFAKRNYKVSLISFCEFEEDKKAIDKIKNMIPEEYKNSVEEILYQGDIEDFIKKYSNMEYMVCTRFHSMILSIMLKQKIYNLCYSKKQENAINDFSLFRKIDRIDNLSFETKLRKWHFRKVSKSKYIKLVSESKGQVSKFEKWLNDTK